MTGGGGGQQVVGRYRRMTPASLCFTTKSLFGETGSMPHNTLLADDIHIIYSYVFFVFTILSWCRWFAFLTR